MDTDARSRYEPSEWAGVLAKEGPVVLLESQSGGHPESTQSYLAARPRATIKAFGNQIHITRSGKENTRRADPWEALAQFRCKEQDWLFGYLGYDLKNYLEDLNSGNPDPVGAPDLWFMVPGLLLWWEDKDTGPQVLRGRLPDMSIPPVEVKNIPVLQGPETTLDKQAYMEAIGEAQRRIREGEFYEVNLSHQLEGTFRGSPLELYHSMKEIGPVPFGAWLSLGDRGISVCSQSPERFLKKEGGRVFSQPIKGTIHRGDEAIEDRQLKQDLGNSVKDRAENLMIVDLVRNDLSRVANNNSVKVTRLFDIQSFGTVHQMVSTVEAEAAVEDPVEIIKACYPMGSMTGAPKIRAMKTIEELENYKRGIYSGAIGYLTPGGDFDFNVVIRTAIIRDDRLWYPVGGAITSDSDPEDEWRETLVKARALTHVLKNKS